jgi:hypothetical protein
MIERYIDHELFLSHEELCTLTLTNKQNFTILKSLSNAHNIKTEYLQKSNIKIDDYTDIIIESDNSNNQRIWLRDCSVFTHNVLEYIDKNILINPIEIHNYIEETI